MIDPGMFQNFGFLFGQGAPQSSPQSFEPEAPEEPRQGFFERLAGRINTGDYEASDNEKRLMLANMLANFASSLDYRAPAGGLANAAQAVSQGLGDDISRFQTGAQKRQQADLQKRQGEQALKLRELDEGRSADLFEERQTAKASGRDAMEGMLQAAETATGADGNPIYEPAELLNLRILAGSQSEKDQDRFHRLVDRGLDRGQFDQETKARIRRQLEEIQAGVRVDPQEAFSLEKRRTEASLADSTHRRQELSQHRQEGRLQSLTDDFSRMLLEEAKAQQPDERQLMISASEMATAEGVPLSEAMQRLQSQHRVDLTQIVPKARAMAQQVLGQAPAGPGPAPPPLAQPEAEPSPEVIASLQKHMGGLKGVLGRPQDGKPPELRALEGQDPRVKDFVAKARATGATWEQILEALARGGSRQETP